MKASLPAYTGRFAPSPTGPLHLGNLRTALAAWLAARAEGRGFLVRMEDLDRVTSSPEHEAGQLADLAAVGIDALASWWAAMRGARVSSISCTAAVASAEETV